MAITTGNFWLVVRVYGAKNASPAEVCLDYRFFIVSTFKKAELLGCKFLQKAQTE
jgi:hypothetical protein